MATDVRAPYHGTPVDTQGPEDGMGYKPLAPEGHISRVVKSELRGTSRR